MLPLIFPAFFSKIINHARKISVYSSQLPYTAKDISYKIQSFIILQRSKDLCLRNHKAALHPFQKLRKNRPASCLERLWGAGWRRQIHAPISGAVFQTQRNCWAGLCRRQRKARYALYALRPDWPLFDRLCWEAVVFHCLSVFSRYVRFFVPTQSPRRSRKNSVPQ